MQKAKIVILSLLIINLFACRTLELEKKTIQINTNDGKSRVLEIMGTPEDRQFLGQNEVWQYCIIGAGFGYHDYRVIWFRNGQVTGITSYKDTTTASSCEGHFKTIRWEDAPDQTIEIRKR